MSVAVARAHRAQQEAIARRTATATDALWSQMDPNDFDGSWQEIEERVFVAVSAGQENAAARADDYLDAALSSQGISDRRPDGHVNPSAFSGVASDGRPLETLLKSPVKQAKIDAMQGLSGVDALARSGFRMMTLASTQVADAGRNATSVGMAATSRVAGYVRMTAGKPCARCAILSGKVYKWNDGFLRHPFCMCTHVPQSSVQEPPTSPDDYFRSLSKEEQDRIFTKAGARAVREGADINQVVNARRGMKTVDAYGKRINTTLEGTTRRGEAGRTMRRELEVQFGKQQGGGRYRRINLPRLTPEQIYADARDRADAIRLLKRFGYLHGGF